MVLAHCSLDLLGSSDPTTSVSQVPRTRGMRHHAWLIFVFFVEMGFHHVDQAGLKLLTSSDLPTSASRSAGITGVSCRAWPLSDFGSCLWCHTLMQGERRRACRELIPPQTPSLMVNFQCQLG
uniref:Uncharacterized protein n=1 Tax=Macaca mulatta TaxID=9544 RepID=A0A5F7ZCG7_MACMU